MLRYVNNAMRLTDYYRPFAGIVKPGIAQMLTTQSASRNSAISAAGISAATSAPCAAKPRNVFTQGNSSWGFDLVASRRRKPG